MNRLMTYGVLAAWTGLFSGTSSIISAERAESFDVDPHWEGRNNRSPVPPVRKIVQDFGYSPTNHAGGKTAGEFGGFVTPAAEPAYYAAQIAEKTFQDTLEASGTLACRGRQFHVLVGFFNSDTLKEWRTPNTIALRLYGRGERFYAYVEYATARWRAGGDEPRPFKRIRDQKTGRQEIEGFASAGAIHTWSLRYDPRANRGHGSITATIDDQVSVCHLVPGHQKDGARFNRFGMLNVIKHADSGGELWFDDITINGRTEHFDHDPDWERFQSRRTHESVDVRPRFDFGFSPTQYAGGKTKGELGGLIFRGDNRDPEKMASYADRLENLNLNKPLRAAGKVCLKRGISDSTTLLGFFHSENSFTANQDQSSAIPEHFLGVAVEGPSREGFFFYPTYRISGKGGGRTRSDGLPRILPNGAAHDWTLDYEPGAAESNGRVTATLDGQSVHIDLPAADALTGAEFDRFGIITTWIDGNGQQVFFDDLSYTRRQP